MLCQQTVLIVLPTVVTAPSANNAMSAASSPYSSRSCPSSEWRRRPPTIRFSAATATGDCMNSSSTHTPGSRPRQGRGRRQQRSRRPPTIETLRRRGELVRDRLEDRLHAAAGRADRTNRDERDQRHEQRVLQQVLALFVARERLHVVQKHRHVILPRGLCTAHLRCE